MKERLTDESHWSSVYTQAPEILEEKPVEEQSLLRRVWHRLAGNHAVLTRESFSNFHFWNILLPQYFKADPKMTVLEVGSAPGMNLIRFHEQFQFQPFGVEFTENGTVRNRQLFASKGINPNQVIKADFFSEAFQGEFQERFDMVFSQGFIEHFTDVEKVIGAHLSLLKPGGYLVVSIPNLSGFNYHMVEKYAAHVIPLHNLTIMNLPAFKKLFTRPELDPIYCGYQGGIHLLMGAIDGATISNMKLLRYSQFGANMMQVVTGPLDTKWTSPNLLFVGKKGES